MNKGTKILIGVGVGASVAVTLIILLRKKMPPLTTASLQNAYQLGLDLGTAYPFYDPLSWTENDSEAEALIVAIPDSDILQLSEDYNKLFSRDLSQDLQQKLDGWSNVSYKFISSVPGQATGTLTPAINKAAKKIRIKKSK